MNEPLTALVRDIERLPGVLASRNRSAIDDHVALLIEDARRLAARQSPSVDALAEAHLTPWYGSPIDGEPPTYMRKCIDIRCLGTSRVVPSTDEPVTVEHRDGCAVREFMHRLARLSPAPAGEDEPTSAEIECDRECNSDCHPDDCEHHGHLPRRASEAASGNMGSEKDGRWAHGIERETVMHGVDAPYAITEFLAYLPTGHVKSSRCPCRPRKSARGPWVHSPEALA